MSEPNPEVERESMEVDVLYVGAGPATLASAYHLMKQVEAHNEKAATSGERAHRASHHFDSGEVCLRRRPPALGGP